MGDGAGRGGGGPVVRRPGGPAAGGQVVQDRAGGRLGVVEERCQGGVELLDGGRAGLEGGQGLPAVAVGIRSASSYMTCYIHMYTSMYV